MGNRTDLDKEIQRITNEFKNNTNRYNLLFDINIYNNYTLFENNNHLKIASI